MLAAFAAFAVVASFATIYGVQLHVEDAMASFQSSMTRGGQVDHLRLGALRQLARLRDVLDGRRQPNESYHAERDAFFVALEEYVRFAPAGTGAHDWTDLRHLAGALRQEFDHCLALAESDRQAARQLMNERIAKDLGPALGSRLQSARTALDDSRQRSVDSLVATHTQVLILAAVVGASGAGLVAIGAALIRRWLMVPIGRLQRAVEEFGRGSLELRLEAASNDELGALGATLNRMAASLVEARADLRRSEAKYRSLFENLRDAVVICDADGNLVECHDGDARLLARETGEHVGCHLLDVWPHWRSGRTDWVSLIDYVMTSGRQFRAVAVVLPCGDGTGDDAVVDLVAYPVEYGDVRYAAIVLRDVSERRRLEEQVRQAEAMEATVTFARGVAHDFNNLLTSAIGRLSLVEPTIADPQQRERIRAAARACWQAAGLSSRLLNFANASEGYPQVFCLDEVVDLILSSLDEDLLEGIRLVREGDPSVLVRIDRDHLTRVVLNLIRNACEAMPNGGGLRIRTESGPAAGAVADQASSRCAVLTVADTGCGMTQEVRQRVFEPFFTTKEGKSRRGRGMGLAVVYAAVRSAGGSIRVESQVGVGTEFQIHLPAGEGTPEPADIPTGRGWLEGGSGTILLVEDDQAMLRTCAEAFEECGYSVITAEGVCDAQAKVAASRSGGVDLAVIDVHLPDGNGVHLAAELVRASPGLRLVFISGFAGTEVPSELEPHVRARLLKPFHLDTLARAVSAALADP